MYKSVHLSKILPVRGSFHSSGSSKDSVFRLFSPAFHRNRPFHDLWKELSLFSKLDFLPSFYLLEEKFVEDYSIYSLNFLFNNSILHEIDTRVFHNFHRFTKSRISCYEKISQVIVKPFRIDGSSRSSSLTSSTCAHEPRSGAHPTKVHTS